MEPCALSEFLESSEIRYFPRKCSSSAQITRDDHHYYSPNCFPHLFPMTPPPIVQSIITSFYTTYLVKWPNAQLDYCLPGSFFRLYFNLTFILSVFYDRTIYTRGIILNTSIDLILYLYHKYVRDAHMYIAHPNPPCYENNTRVNLTIIVFPAWTSPNDNIHLTITTA